MTIKEAFNNIKQRLNEAGVDDPAFDTIYLFEHVLSFSRKDITVYGDKQINEKAFCTLNELANRRISGEPIQYILGYWFFMGEKYTVCDGVLIPRDDTQVLVNACTKLLEKKPDSKIVDLCSGSGIIAVTLKKQFADSTVFAVEKSETAYGCLIKNCEDNHADVKAIHADLYDCTDFFDDNSLDLIASNPPYIITSEIDTLQKEVQYEPKMALDGGKDGYDFYRGIINHWSKKLKKGGHIAFEIGENQFEYIKKLLENSGFSDVQGYLDLSLTTRAMTAIYNS
ncbi:MAG: peptide chain release factor N(5)-glutamine methyltransferase [Ruminococcus sp.]|nr:peptide chain release factor N(5)-glutamine methyltransferase [Ruminococcus sp.]